MFFLSQNFSINNIKSLASEGGKGEIQIINVEGTITAGTAYFITDQIRKAGEDSGVAAVIISLNTPGGLVNATLDITRSMLDSPVPVIVYVNPYGAIAASAGAFILVSGHIAAMAPGTTTGAAMPVNLVPTEGSSVQPADQKTINFLAGHIGSIAKERGRPVETVKKFVTANLTLDSREALEQGVIDFTAGDLAHLLQQLQGSKVDVKGKTITLDLLDKKQVEMQMSLSEKIQHWVSDPQTAFLLLLGGAAAIYLGLTMPGTFVPEVLGTLALLLGVYGMGLFDASTAGLVFIVLGLALLVAEFFTAGFGILGIGGAACLLAGSLMLPLEPLLPENWYPAFRTTAVAASLTVGFLAAAVITAVVRSRYRRKTSLSLAARETGKVIEDLNPEGMVHLRGENWKARSEGEEFYPRGTPVEVVKREGLTLVVRRKTENNNKEKER